ncbi:hypothetical protein IT084_15615 [Desulfallas sp. Bu1-1]|uniref:hypothetical protein n=1 Tax=Desulfallas sp. Bu1-1 TaxID=2787620 RepID=UPI00189CDEC2|nr:hypothetical protein [Desulfallas sp. Bu1-1]MBF7084381.1 hypothetical protein [Desulfallas sp. Bu1-1]
MNEHSQRLIERILEAFELYEKKKITAKELVLNVEGNCNALEEKALVSMCKKILSKIDDAIHLYNENEGRNFLLKEFKLFKEAILNHNR